MGSGRTLRSFATTRFRDRHSLLLNGEWRWIPNREGLDAALFGRMTTGDMLARCDAAIHVAHAFTVHEGQPIARRSSR